MITNQVTQWLSFRGREVAPRQGMWEVFTVDGNKKLGTIMWFEQWGKYGFSCTGMFSADSEPLQDIVRFLDARTAERNAP